MNRIFKTKFKNFKGKLSSVVVSENASCKGKCKVTNAIAIGTNAYSVSKNGLAIGDGAINQRAKSIVIGANSKITSWTNQTHVVILGLDNEFGNGAESVVIGSKNKAGGNGIIVGSNNFVTNGTYAILGNGNTLQSNDTAITILGNYTNLGKESRYSNGGVVIGLLSSAAKVTRQLSSDTKLYGKTTKTF